jgi:hypothetical protein
MMVIKMPENHPAITLTADLPHSHGYTSLIKFPISSLNAYAPVNIAPPIMRLMIPERIKYGYNLYLLASVNTWK